MFDLSKKGGGCHPLLNLMSTHCLVAVKNPKGYEAIWVRWDGYVNGVGKTLLENFNTRELACELVSLGACETVYEAKNIKEVKSYHRDYNEKWRDSQSSFFKELKEFSKLQSYVYIFQDNAWHVTMFSTGNIIPVYYALMEGNQFEEALAGLWDDWNFGNGEQKTKDLFDVLCKERDRRKEDE